MKLMIISVCLFVCFVFTSRANCVDNSSLGVDGVVDSVQFRTLLDFGFAGLKLRDDDIIFTIHSVNGLQFKNGFFAGVGSGVEFFDLHVVPLFLDLKYEFLHSYPVTPYLYADCGYSFPFGKQENDDKIEGGMLYGGGLGLRGQTKKGHQYAFSVGYRYQSLRNVFQDNWQGVIDRHMEYNRIYVKFGWYLN